MNDTYHIQLEHLYNQMHLYVCASLKWLMKSSYSISTNECYLRHLAIELLY